MLKTYCSKIAKFVFILLVTPLFFVAYEANAQTSTTINFQGKIVRNDTGYEGLNVTTGSPACVASGADTCDFQIKYYSASTGGTLYLTETFINKEIGDYQGIFNLSLGSGTMTAGTYSNLDQLINGSNSIYVEVLFSPAGNSTFTETFSRMPLQAAPFAIRSKYSEMAKGAFKFENAASSTGYTGSDGMVYYDTTDSTLKLYSGGTWTPIATGGSSIWQSASISAFSHSPSQFLETTGIATLANFGVDTSENRAWVQGASAKTGFSVYSNYGGATDWPLVTFKADASNFGNSILQLIQDGTGSILEGYKGSNRVFDFDNRGDLHLSSDGIMYLEPFTASPTNLYPASGEGCLYNLNGSLYWDATCSYNGIALATGNSSLWTDGGTFTYLTSTTDDIYFGGNTLGTSTFVFDVDASGGNYLEIDNALNTQRLFTIDANGNVGIGTDTPTAKLDIGGTNSNIINAMGDITITPAQNLIISQGYVGIGTTTPTSLFSVGSTSQFQVSTTGDIVKIKNLTYSWPSAHTTNGFLVNNGSGTLSWSTITALGGVTGTGSGTATAGQITFWNSSTSITGDNGFWWDNANKRLGIGTNTPQASLDIAGATSEIANTDGDIVILPANNLIVSGGNLGINTTSVSKTLTIAGNMSMYYTNTGTGSMNIFDTTYTQSVAAPSGTIYGYYNKANYTATGTMLEMGAAKYDAQNDSTGTVTRLYTLDANVFNKTTGTVTTAAAIHARGFQEAYAGTISSLHTILVENAHKGSGGTITGQSGLTVAGLNTGTYNTHLLLGTTTIPSGNYAIYSGSSYESYFSGIVTVAGAGSSSGLRLAGGGTKMYTDGTNGAIRMVPGNGWFAVRDGADTVNTLLVSSSYTQVYSKLGIGTSSTISLAIGDTDTGFNWVSDGNFALYTNNVERVRFASNGNVGIGTVSPVEVLDVNGNIKFQNRLYSYGGSRGNVQISYPYLNITVASQNRPVIYGNNLYLDTSATWQKDNIAIGGSALVMGAPNGMTGGFTFLGLTDTDSATMTVVEQMVIAGNGNVGIGNTNPGAKLHLSGTSDNALIIDERDWSSKARIFFREGGSAAYGGYVGYDAGTDRLVLSTLENSVEKPGIYIARSTGYVTHPAGHADLAENYQTVGTVLRGSLVSINTTTPWTVTASNKEKTSLVGVVTTNPGAVMDTDGGFQIGYETKPVYQNEKTPIALVGTAPTLVTLKNGYIEIGDSIGVSELNGFGAKMTTAGYTVGKALEKINTNTCISISSLDSINWPDDDGKNTLKPCYKLPDGTLVGKIMIAIQPSWYDPSTSATTETLTETGWYRISQLNGTDDYAKIKVNNRTLGSSQNLILSVDTVGGNNSVNVISNFTTGGYDISKARVNSVNGIKYLEIYLADVNSNSIKVSIDGDTNNWIATNIVKVEEGSGIVEYAFNGVLFGISDNFSVTNEGISTSGTLLTSGLTSNIGNSGNRWNDIYTKGTIRLGSGNSEGGIRYNIDKKRLEFSNNGIDWVEMGDLASNMVISPEYSGAILYADGSDNNGKMTSDAVSTNGVFRNYYEWISDKPTLQDYDILVRITLPSDFVSWKENAISLDLMTENSASTSNNKVEIALMGDSGIDTEVKDGISKMPGAWERISIKSTDITECNKAGDSCTLKLSMYSKENYYVRVGDISLSYNRGL
jgi:hypothetical protein